MFIELLNHAHIPSNVLAPEPAPRENTLISDFVEVYPIQRNSPNYIAPAQSSLLLILTYLAKRPIKVPFSRWGYMQKGEIICTKPQTR